MSFYERSGNGETILVVDDAEAIRKMVCTMLSQQGYNCLEAADGAEALNLVRKSVDVQLVLTDMVMPRMGGADLARALSESHPDTRIIFMSGYTDDPIVQSLAKTSSIFLEKPFTASTLIGKIRDAMERSWDGLPDSRHFRPGPV